MNSSNGNSAVPHGVAVEKKQYEAEVGTIFDHLKKMSAFAIDMVRKHVPPMVQGIKKRESLRIALNTYPEEVRIGLHVVLLVLMVPPKGVRAVVENAGARENSVKWSTIAELNEELVSHVAASIKTAENLFIRQENSDDLTERLKSIETIVFVYAKDQEMLFQLYLRITPGEVDPANELPKVM